MAIEIPFNKQLDFEYGRHDYLTPKISRVIANNPSPITFHGTGTYIIGKYEVMLIDAGPRDKEHLFALQKALEGKKLTHILVTHPHGDHYPLSDNLKQIYGASIFGANQEIKGAHIDKAFEKHGFIPDIDLYDGMVISNKEISLRAIASFGHSANHYCFAFDEDNALFSGDHIMGWSSSVVIPPDGNMGEYIANLEKIRDMDFDILYPTHGAPYKKPKPLIEALIAHRHERNEQILNALEWKPNEISHLVRIIYPELNEALIPAACQNIYAHLLYLMELGKVKCNSTPSLAAKFAII